MLKFKREIGTVKLLMLFYKKTVLPAFGTALLVSAPQFVIEGRLVPKIIGVFWIFFIPVFHFVYYEMRKSETYYFYYNLGWSRLHLWIGCIVIMSTIGIFALFL